MLAKPVLVAGLFFTGSLAVPVNGTNSTDESAGDGCAQLSSYVTAAPAAVPASLGYACLQAVPVDVEGGLKLVSEIHDILTWHSTLAYLKNPPKDYPNPAVDILGGLDDILDKLSNDDYKSEYELQNEISTLLAKAYDGHLAYVSDISAVIGFGRDPATSELVSLSSDGITVPKVYLKSDFDRVQAGADFTPSAISAIDGQPVYDFLVAFAANDFSFHDPDARYQNLFWNPAGVSEANMSSSSFTNLNTVSADTTVLRHENGTETTISNIAGVQRDLTGIDSGEAFFDAFLRPAPATTTAAPSAAISTLSSTSTPVVSEAPVPTAYNYPYPVNKTRDNSVSGYFLNETDYTDVAVLSSPTFDTEDVDEFQKVVRDFLATATAANRTRLIIDLRHNGGGRIILGFDLFKQLFPQLEPYGGSRLRAIDAIDAMGQVVSSKAERLLPAGNATVLSSVLFPIEGLSVDEFWYGTGLDSHGEAFGSWDDEFGPQRMHSDSFTQIVRHNWSEPILNGRISGYGDLSDLPPQPFESTDIVLLQDGFCASTCSIFAELMKTQGGVRQVLLGGRPHTQPAVAVGGTKGSETITFDDVINKAAYVVQLAEDTDNDDDRQSMLQLLEDAGVIALANATAVQQRTAVNPNSGERRAAINYRNAYRQDAADGTPLQFVPDYADRRLFYTASMLYDPTVIWTTVADAMWGDGSRVAD